MYCRQNYIKTASIAFPFIKLYSTQYLSYFTVLAMHEHLIDISIIGFVELNLNYKIQKTNTTKKNYQKKFLA